MRISDKGLKFISSWEGEVLHIYLDVVGIPTVGVGHVVLPGEDFTGGITHQEAIDLLRKDVAKCEKVLNDTEVVKVTLTQNQFDSLCSWLFNVGTGALARSTTLAKLNQGDVTGAASGLLLWVKAGGHVNQGLLNRRKAERQVFLTPDEPTIDGGSETVAPISPDSLTPTTAPVIPGPFSTCVNFIQSIFTGKKK